MPNSPSRMSRWLARGQELLRSAEANMSWYRVAMLVIVLTGIVFRTRGYWVRPIGLWLDEAWWAVRMLAWPVEKLKFRPVGYMLATRLIANIYCSEQTVRLLSWLPGVVSVPVAVYVASRLFKQSWARLLTVFVVAFHPELIDMSREFKPYELEFCAHLGVLALLLRYQETGAKRWLYAL
ncbi:MAG TPA: glycosyltransferase family 39 protein, partial [Polyangiaceae bacterium]|nr:glycosyltransferase family 39 protein [Polyangiaceae bacterium]